MLVLSLDQIETAYYLRMQGTDRPGVLGEVASILGGQGISIEAVVQKEPTAGEETVPLILLTHRVMEGRMNGAITRIENLDCIEGRVARIRVEYLE